jgi:hypothetical protein
MPSLAAWAALLVADTSGLFILALAVAAMLWVDLRATRAGEAPPWYPNLRIPLTCIVVAALLLGGVLELTRFRTWPQFGPHTVMAGGADRRL